MSANRKFLLLLASQFLSAMGESAIWVVILGQLTFERQRGLLGEQELSIANAAYACLLFVPYVFLAPIAGYLNDRYAKSHWLLGGNLLKLIGTAVATLSVVGGGPLWQGIGYFIVGIGACLYSPAKYGILPEILPAERLVKANGTLEMLTLVAILTGVIVGASLIDSWSVLACYGVLWLIFGGASVINAWMPATPVHPEIRWGESLRQFSEQFRRLFANRRLAWILIGTSLFWICVAMMKINFQPWGLNALRLPSNTSIALLNLWMAIGVMVGSVLAGEFHSVGDLRGTRWYGFLLGVFMVGLYAIRAQTPQGIVILALMFAGVSAGLFLIPLDAALQAESDQSKLGKTIAIQNFLNNIAMMIGGVLIWAGAKFGANASGNFLVMAGLIAMICFFLRIPSRAPVAAGGEGA